MIKGEVICQQKNIILLRQFNLWMLFNIGSSEGGGAAIWMPAAVAVANHWLAHRATI